MRYRISILSLFTLLFFSCLFAEEIQKDHKAVVVPKEKISDTNHLIQIHGKPFPYRAVAGNLILKNAKGEPSASFFYVAYTKEGVQNPSERPITFCFNGGPGSSSVWLHIGAFGPKRIALDEKGMPLHPYRLVDNEDSLLSVTDLVFIDPVSTGYSQAFPAEEAKQFHEVEEDIKSIAQFIVQYTTKSNRWTSPKFLAGESYGTTRGAGIANQLQSINYLTLNGLILISPALNFQTFSFQGGNDLPYITFLPTYTAAAWYHKKLPSDLSGNLSKALEESKEFAFNEYALALLRGDSLSKEEREKTAKKLSKYTGLSIDYITRANLRISMHHYIKELLRNKGEVLGYFDCRVTGIDVDGVGEFCSNGYDASLESIIGAFTAAFNSYLRNDLKWETEEEYKILVDLSPWGYSKAATNRFLNMTDTLRQIMTENPHLHTFVATGIFDMATPYMGAKYTFDHLNLAPSLRSHVQQEIYPTGHMMYIQDPSRIKFLQDLTEFIQTRAGDAP